MQHGFSHCLSFATLACTSVCNSGMHLRGRSACMCAALVPQAFNASNAGHAPIQQGRVAVKCMAGLLEAAPHFNYRSGGQALTVVLSSGPGVHVQQACPIQSVLDFKCRSASSACGTPASQG